MVSGSVLGDEGRGQSGGGVVGHQGAQVGCDPGGLGRGSIVHGAHDASHALRILRAVERPDGREVPSGARIDEVNQSEVPARDADAEQKKCAIGGGDLEADAIDGDGAVAASLDARELGAERPPQGVGVGAFATDGGPAEVALERCPSITRCLRSTGNKTPPIARAPGYHRGTDHLKRLGPRVYG